jgi:DNA-binding transcriptional ArsR family regulator
MNKKIRKEELLAVANLVLVRSGKWMVPDEIVEKSYGSICQSLISIPQMASTLRKAGTRPIFRCSPDTMCPGITLDGYSRLDELGIVARERDGIVQYRAKAGR